jgi:hypothetical protein
LQHAINGTERAAYEKLIVPFLKDMPRTDVVGFSRVCNEHKYAFFSSEIFRKLESNSLSCRLDSLPGTSFPETLTYMISKSSPYKGLINWR